MDINDAPPLEQIDRAIAALQEARKRLATGRIYSASKLLREAKHRVYGPQCWCANRSLKAAMDFGNAFRIAGTRQYGITRA